jgi:hypothetical protein
MKNAIMLNVTNNPFIMIVVMLSVVLLNVMPPGYVITLLKCLKTFLSAYSKLERLSTKASIKHQGLYSQHFVFILMNGTNKLVCLSLANLSSLV